MLVMLGFDLVFPWGVIVTFGWGDDLIVCCGLFG